MRFPIAQVLSVIPVDTVFLLPFIFDTFVCVAVIKNSISMPDKRAMEANDAGSN
ncbi:MAG: hypothetical protein QM654_06845 [Dysgonamonadaceae bacterium]